MTKLIDSLRRGVPTGLEQIAQLGRHADILALFDHHASNRPTEAINGRLETIDRNALGFRHLTHHRIVHCSTAAHFTNSWMHSELRRARLRKYGGAQHISNVVIVAAGGKPGCLCDHMRATRPGPI